MHRTLLDHTDRLWIATPLNGLLRYDNPASKNPTETVYLKENGLSSVTLTGAFNGTAVAASGNGLFQGSVRADTIGMKQLWNGGSAQICTVDVQGYKYISNCSSSRRYKDEIEDYRSGLDVLKSLRPVTFRWKSNGQKDVGFVAEEVNEAEPLLNNFNEKG